MCYVLGRFKLSDHSDSFRDTAPLTEVIKKLSLCKVYRIFVVDASGKPCSIVSLSDVLRYISSIDAGIYDKTLHF